MSPYEIPVTELPEHLIAQISKVLGSFSTGIIKIPDRPRGQEEIILIGSGTFVSINGIYGILTAHHVAELLDPSSSLAVILVPEEQKKSIRVNLIRVIEIARGPVKSEGPDLSFIKLPEAFVSEIRPYKQFFNISLRREKMLNNPLGPHAGVWFFWGLPDELTTVERSQREQSKRVKCFQSISGMFAPSREYSSGEYDYIEVNIDPKVPHPVSTFGGVSGGGLWQVLIRESADGSLEPFDHVLSGVVFYESEIGSERGFLKCHGRRSVYKNTYDKVTEMCS